MSCESEISVCAGRRRLTFPVSCCPDAVRPPRARAHRRPRVPLRPRRGRAHRGRLAAAGGGQRIGSWTRRVDVTGGGLGARDQAPPCGPRARDGASVHSPERYASAFRNHSLLWTEPMAVLSADEHLYWNRGGIVTRSAKPARSGAAQVARLALPRERAVPHRRLQRQGRGGLGGAGGPRGARPRRAGVLAAGEPLSRYM